MTRETRVKWWREARFGMFIHWGIYSQLCRGDRLCFYYSHVREWHHPLAQSFEGGGNYGNFWDYPDDSKKDLGRFIDGFVKPQLKELLTQYGPIGCIWFDTPSFIGGAKAKE